MNLNSVIGYFEGFGDYIWALEWPANKHTIRKSGFFLFITVLFVSGKVRQKKARQRHRGINKGHNRAPFTAAQTWCLKGVREERLRGRRCNYMTALRMGGGISPLQSSAIILHSYRPECPCLTHIEAPVWSPSPRHYPPSLRRMQERPAGIVPPLFSFRCNVSTRGQWLSFIITG